MAPPCATGRNRLKGLPNSKSHPWHQRGKSDQRGSYGFTIPARRLELTGRMFIRLCFLLPCTSYGLGKVTGWSAWTGQDAGLGLAWNERGLVLVGVSKHL
jgi:hypothetical protein